MIECYDYYGHPTKMELRKRVDIIPVKERSVNGMLEALELIKTNYGNITIVVECPNEYSGDIENMYIYENQETGDMWGEIHSS